MPIYSYKCDKCGHEDEQHRAVDDRHSPKRHGIACDGILQLQITAPLRTPTKWGDSAKLNYSN